MNDVVVAYINQPGPTKLNNENGADYNGSKNVNAFTGEYYNADSFDILTLEDASAMQLGGGVVAFSLASFNNDEILTNWGSVEEFLRITGGTGS